MPDICRLCLFEISTPNISINKDTVSNEAKIKVVVPEIDLNMTSSFALCNLCTGLLGTAFEFKHSCLKTEENLKQFLNEQHLSVPLDLRAYKDAKQEDLIQIKDEITEEYDNFTEIDNTEDIRGQFNVDIGCDNCGSIFHDNDSYDIHKQQCDFNQSSNDKKRNLLEDVAKLHQCLHCNKLFSSALDLRIHLLHEHSSFQCDSANTNSFRQIKRTRKPNKTYSCPVCNKKLTKKSYLRHHMESQCNMSRVCNICGLSIKGTFELKQHKLTEHRKQHICETCGFGCSTKSRLIEHIRSHTGERPYWCKLCGKGFSQKSSLSTHNRAVHESTCEYVCENCGKTFRLKGNLTKHMQVHRDQNAEKTFCCEFGGCGKSFYTARDRTKHMVRHGEKNVICDICGTAFATKNGLKRHKMIHTGEKPHECDICQKTFSQRCNLKVHLKSHRSNRREVKKSLKNECNDESNISLIIM